MNIDKILGPKSENCNCIWQEMPIIYMVYKNWLIIILLNLKLTNYQNKIITERKHASIYLPISSMKVAIADLA